MFVRKTLLLWLCVVLLLLIIPGCGAEEVVSTTESGFTTRFNPNTGTLTVSGEGVLKGLYPRKWIPEHLSETLKEDHTIKKVIIEEGIVCIKDCFNDLKALKTIVFPTTLEIIRSSFIACNSLKKVIFPKTVKEICDESFSYCTDLTTLRFQGPKKILHKAFADLSSLNEVTISNDSLLCDVFYNCYNLKKITIGKGVICHPEFAEIGSTCWGSFAVSEPERVCKRTFYLPEERSETLDEGLAIFDWDIQVYLQ